MLNVFISYSWDSEEHSKWVKDLANKLITEEGINTYIDQYDILPGYRLTQAMEELLKQSDYVFCV